jgi:hypothetical protein
MSARTEDPRCGRPGSRQQPWLTSNGRLHCCSLKSSFFLYNSLIAASSYRKMRKRGKIQSNKHNYAKVKAKKANK